MGNKSNAIKSENRSIPNIILYIEENRVNKKFKDLLAKKYSKNVTYFKDLKSLENHLLINPDEKIFLITSGAFGLKLNEKGIFSSVNSPIEYIFIYCKDVEGHKSWSSKINKIALVSVKYKEIIQKVDEKYSEKLLESKIPDHEKSIPNYLIENSDIIEFLSSQFILGMFENEKANYDQLIKEAEKDFLKYCRDNHAFFGVSEDELNKLILDIENGRFSGSNVVEWFTKENSLLFKIVDFNLTNVDIVNSFKIRMALYKLSEALRGYHLKHDNIQYVYKASSISDSELLLLMKYSNSKDYVQMRGYTLTAVEEDLVKPNKKKSIQNPELKYVIYKIEIKSLQNDLVYDLTNFNLKGFLLLDNKAFLNILKVEEKTDKIDFDFIVHCELAYFETVLCKLNSYLSPIPKINAELKIKKFSDGIFYLCETLLVMEEYDKLIDIISKKEFVGKDLDNYTHNYYMGRAHYKKGDYEEALRFYHNSLEIIYKLNQVVEATDKSTHFCDFFEEPCNYCDNLEDTYNLNILEVKSFPDVYPDLPTLFYHIGNVNYNKQEYSKAIEHYNIISKIRSKISFENSTLYDLDNMIGQSYKKLGKYKDALSFFNSFLNSSLKNSAHDNLNAGIAYNNLGSINLIQSQNDAALKYFKDSLAEYDKKNLPVDHPYRALTYSNIGLANEKLNKLKEAITSYEKCLEITSKYMAKDHRKVTTLEEKIKVIKQNSNL